ncbi:hypothetical protein N0V95_005406 [Ascochyta clinopodiicola]|nr:hypothetical protein N0V95_005406 [Ascochyta clinopodiicola]
MYPPIQSYSPELMFPSSLFTDMPGFNGSTNIADTIPIPIDSPMASPYATVADPGIVLHKSRIYGPSHWMSLLAKHDLFDDIKGSLFTGEAHAMLTKCKDLARSIKTRSRPNLKLLSRPLSDLMPNKETADRLVQLYLRTFESVFSLMHVPTFQQEYVEHWNHPQATKESFIIQLLLIMAIDTQAIGGDLAWIAMGSLMQRAMAIGLHIKPSQLPISPLEAETRRRIWTTILELSVQSSLDSGTFPIIPRDALDNFEPPSNIDDSQLSESTQKAPVPQPPSTFTRSSIQCALIKSLPIRIKIAEALSQPPYKLTYDSVRSMGAELTAHLRETSQLIKSFHFTRPSAFQIHLQDFLARRFLFTLHMQFVHRAPDNVNYHFSRTACLESALLLCGPSFSRNADDNNYLGDEDGNTSASLNDYQNLRLHGDGLFKNVLLAAAMALCAELLIQLREDSSPAASSLLRMPLVKAIRDTVSLMWRRIQRGETSTKSFVFVTCVLARIDASRNHTPPEQKKQIDQVVADTAKHVLGVCAKFLTSRLGDTSSSPSSSELDVNLALKEHIVGLDRWLPLEDREGSSESVLRNSLSSNATSDDADDMSIWLNDATSVWNLPAWGNEPMFD